MPSMVMVMVMISVLLFAFARFFQNQEQRQTPTPKEVEVGAPSIFAHCACKISSDRHFRVKQSLAHHLSLSLAHHSRVGLVARPSLTLTVCHHPWQVAAKPHCFLFSPTHTPSCWHSFKLSLLFFQPSPQSTGLHCTWDLGCITKY